MKEHRVHWFSCPVHGVHHTFPPWGCGHCTVIQIWNYGDIDSSFQRQFREKDTAWHTWPINCKWSKFLQHKAKRMFLLAEGELLQLLGCIRPANFVFDIEICTMLHNFRWLCRLIYTRKAGRMSAEVTITETAIVYTYQDAFFSISKNKSGFIACLAYSSGKMDTVWVSVMVMQTRKSYR